MDSLTNRLLTRLTNARSGERAVALLMFAYSFLAMTSHNILKPVIKSKFITQVGADDLPVMLLASSVVIGVLMHLYGGAVRRLPRQYVVPLTQSVLVALLVVFWALLRTNAVWVTVALYLFGQVLGILLISQFWTLANDVYDARQAKRLFGLIGGGACLGGALGNSITLVTSKAGDHRLLISAAVLALCAVVVVQIVRRPNVGHHTEFAEDLAVGGREAFRLLVQSHHLRVLAAIVGLAVIGAAVVDLQLSMAAQAFHVDEDEITALLAKVGASLSLAGFVVQVGLTSRIHSSFGLTAALLLLPVGLGTSATLILLTGSLLAVGAARVLDGTLRYSLDKTTREMLFLPVPADLRFRAKPFIDVTMEKFGKAFAAVLLLVLIRPWGLELDWQELSYASLVITAVWIAVALVAWREYLRAFRASIGSRAIAPGTIRTAVDDPATIETLVEELSNPDEPAVLYAMEMLEALDRRHLITPLLLQHASPRVRARALRAVAAIGSHAAGRWLATIERMVQDEDVDVRAAALHALADLAHEDAAVIARRHLADAEPRVVVTAAIALADAGQPEDVGAAQTALLQIIGDTRDLASAGRTEAAVALGHIEHPRFRPLLVPLLYDREVAVVRKAIASARTMGASDGLFVPGLLSLLGHRSLKAEARAALVGSGEAIVPALAHALGDTREHVWIRRHIPATLARLGTAQAMDALVRSLDEPDGFLRYKAITAIETLRRDHPSIACPRPVLEAAVVRETSRYYNGLTLQQNLLRDALDGGESLLAHALADKLSRSVDRIYRLLGLIYHVGDVAAARYTIEQGESRRRAAAVEYLDNLLGGSVRKHVMPILDDTPLAEKVRYANLVLKSRPRDLEDTLAQLVHDDDPVIAGSAIHFIAHRQVWSLTDDLEYVTKHRPPGDQFVIEAASWALAARHSHATSDTLPAVELVDLIRATPLFASLSVDELFRIAEAGQKSRHPAGQELYRAGYSAGDVFFLLEGRLEVTPELGPARQVETPAVMNVEDVLQGTPRRTTVRTLEPTIGFRIPTEVFLTMVSDNPLMAQGLFRLLLGEGGRRSPDAWASQSVSPGSHGSAGAAGGVRLLRKDPLLARATTTELLALVSAASEMDLTAGALLFDVDAPPAIYQVVHGDLRLESGDRTPILATPGATFGVADTLAGTASPWRATALTDGRVLRLERDDLFAVMADHVDLMQRLFTAALTRRDEEASAATSPARPSFA